MSLRKVRSLPSLRILSEAANPLVKAGAAVPPLPFQVRSVHNTKKNEHTTLLNSDKHGMFTRMSLKALKNECRSRGLKVSGRKSELVERILMFEGKTMQGIHTSSTKKAKNDDSHIDFMYIPNVAELERAREKRSKDDYIVKVPPLTNDAKKVPITKSEKILEAKGKDAEEKPLTEKVGVIATPDDTNTIKAPAGIERVEIVNEETETQSYALTKAHPNFERKTSDEELSSRDKKFLFGFAGTVAAWWSLTTWGERKSKK